MPYIRRGKRVYKKSGSKLIARGKSKSLKMAKKHLRVLNAIEHGWRPPKKRKK